MHKFDLGRTLATPGALAALEESGQSPAFFLDKHTMGDWGDVNQEDKQANDEALTSGERLLSAYKTLLGQRIWIITEAVDDQGKRARQRFSCPKSIELWAASSDFAQNFPGTVNLRRSNTLCVSKEFQKRFWIVTKPTHNSELGDCCFDVDFRQFALQIRGGLNIEDIVGFFADRNAARKNGHQIACREGCR